MKFGLKKGLSDRGENVKEAVDNSLPSYRDIDFNANKRSSVAA